MFKEFPIARLPLYYSAKKRGRFLPLPINVVFVTTLRCNSRCKTCFIWRGREDCGRELSLDEYQKVLKAMPKTYWVTVGGGEVFLREDAAAIVRAICDNLKPRIVTIPSNGSSPEKISLLANELSKKYPGIRFIFNLSLDNIAEKHDAIRGMPGSFSLLSESIKRLKEIKNNNLSLGIHTVISDYNFSDFISIYNWVKENINPDFHIIEDAQVRDEFMNQNAKLLSDKQKYNSAIDFYNAKIKEEKKRGFDRIKKAFRLTYYERVKKDFLCAKKPYPCYAGYISCQINHDGEVWACAKQRFVLGNLRDYGYSFRDLWRSDAANKMRERIKAKDCSCHISNTAYTNMLLSPSAMAKVLINAIKY